MKSVHKLEFFWYLKIKSQRGIIYFFLLVASYLYTLIVYIRTKLYNLDYFKKKKFEKSFIISIGNLTLGGAGKTPMVEYLSNIMTDMNLRASVISRGYGSKYENDTRIRIVTNGKDLLLKQVEAGDEPYMLALQLKKVPIIVNKNRAKAIEAAIEKFNSEVILLDDAFQRFDIHKDLEIVIFDGTNDMKIYKMFPAGILREPMSALQRADICIINKISSKSDNHELLDFIRSYNNSIPVFYGNYKFVSLMNLNTDEIVSFESIMNKNLTIFAGIGNIQKFKNMIEHNLKPQKINSIKFPDHHFYSPRDIKRLQLFANISDAVITTYKDAVKLKNKIPHSSNIYYTIIKMEIEEPESFRNTIQYFLKGGAL